METPAATIIEMLREFWEESANTFEFNASMLIAGPANKRRRQHIIREITGQERPVSKCSYYATITELSKSFSQTSLF